MQRARKSAGVHREPREEVAAHQPSCARFGVRGLIELVGGEHGEQALLVAGDARVGEASNRRPPAGARDQRPRQRIERRHGALDPGETAGDAVQGLDGAAAAAVDVRAQRDQHQSLGGRQTVELGLARCVHGRLITHPHINVNENHSYLIRRNGWPAWPPQPALFTGRTA